MSDNPAAMTESSPTSFDQAPHRARRSLKVQFIVLLCLAMGPAAVIGFFETSAAFDRQAQKTDEALLQAAEADLKTLMRRNLERNPTLKKLYLERFGEASFKTL